MIKLYVGDMNAAEAFYGGAFGAKPALAIGNNANILTFPHGGPGLVLLKSNLGDKKYGAFIIRVPDLRKTQAWAVAHGAKQQGTFAGNPGGQAARSIDLLDPWGNQVEILQIG
jgi:predicted enzyme related to lactoylglutathione lyase